MCKPGEIQESRKRVRLMSYVLSFLLSYSPLMIIILALLKILWSGCKDSQTSADTYEDGAATGAMSYVC